MAVNDRMIPRRGPVKPVPVKPKPKGFKRGPVKPGPVKPKPSKGNNPKLPYRPADPGFFDRKKKAPIGPGKPVGPTPKKRKPGEGERRDPGFVPGGRKKRPQPVKPKPKGGSIRDLLYRAKPGEKLQSSAAGRSLNDQKSRMDSPKKRALPIPRTSRKYKDQNNGKVPTQIKNEMMQKAYAGFLQGNKRTEQIRKDTSPITNKYKYMNMMGPAGPAPKRSPRGPVDYKSMTKSARPIMKPVMPRRGGR